jgi:hypothetical protein
VSRQLTDLLSLRSCRFQYGVAGIGKPAWLQRDGRVMVKSQTWDVAQFGMPTKTDTELLVEAGGRLQGRFLMTPDPAGPHPTREQRLVAVADQVGGALFASQPASRS